MTQTIEQLTARIAELEEENARLNAFMPTDCSNLTIRKTKSIFTDAGSTYKPSGFVLTDAEGKKCIVDMSAVRWMNGNDFFSTMHSDSTMAQQLAASQLHAEQLRKWVIDNCMHSDTCYCLSLDDEGKHMACSCGLTAAIALPHDTSALDAYVAEKVKEYGDEARRQMQHATKAVWQRDLAVEAITRAIDMVGHPDNITYLQQTLDAIKESEAK